MDFFKLHILEKIIDEAGVEGIDESSIETPPDPDLGDYAFPCFLLSKKLRKKPEQIADWLKMKIQPDEIIGKVQTAGPYLNFFVNKAKLAEKTLKGVFESRERYGHSNIGNGKRIIFEFPSPNTNKPLHLGHLRNMVLGESMSNIFESQGYKVLRVNLNNDRGIHICKSMLAYKKWGDGKTPESEKKKSDHFVGDYYVLFSKHSKEEPSLDEEAQDMLRRWEANDPEVRALWKKMNDWAFQGFDKTYKRFGLREFDRTYFESNTYNEGKKIIMDGVKKGIFKKREDGAAIIDLSKEGLGEKVLIRPDGTTVYITQDIFLALLKQREFESSRSVYVVANEQIYHFNVLFTVLKKLGYSWAEGCYHFSYGLVHLPEGRMKSREGTVVDADDLMQEMEDIAEGEIKKRYKDISDNEIRERSRTIGLAAIKFYLAKNDAVKDMTFNPEESISFDGDTGPYIQYTHARACSIIRKAKEQKILPKPDIDFSLLKQTSELSLIHSLYQFPAKVNEACEAYKPHLIAQNLLAIARNFNEFYHVCSCLKEENKELTKARLLLVECARQTISNGLALLGCKAPDEM